jgi:hypothetical protein
MMIAELLPVMKARVKMINLLKELKGRSTALNVSDSGPSTSRMATSLAQTSQEVLPELSHRQITESTTEGVDVNGFDSDVEFDNQGPSTR